MISYDLVCVRDDSSYASPTSTSSRSSSAKRTSRPKRRRTKTRTVNQVVQHWFDNSRCSETLALDCNIQEFMGYSWLSVLKNLTVRHSIGLLIFRNLRPERLKLQIILGKRRAVVLMCEAPIRLLASCATVPGQSTAAAFPRVGINGAAEPAH